MLVTLPHGSQSLEFPLEVTSSYTKGRRVRVARVSYKGALLTMERGAPPRHGIKISAGREITTSDKKKCKGLSETQTQRSICLIMTVEHPEEPMVVSPAPLLQDPTSSELSASFQGAALLRQRAAKPANPTADTFSTRPFPSRNCKLRCGGSYPQTGTKQAKLRGG